MQHRPAPVWSALAWPEPDVGDALLSLARGSGLEPELRPLPRLEGEARASRETRAQWIASAADTIGLHALATDCGYAELDLLLARCAPALVAVVVEGERRYLAVVGTRGRRLRLIVPGGARASIERREVHAALTEEFTAPRMERIDAWLGALRVGRRRARRAREALLRVVLEARRVGGVWLLRADPAAGFLAQVGARRALRRLYFALGLSIVQLGFAAYGWVLLARGALTGSIEPGWLAAWLLATSSAAVLQVASVAQSSACLLPVAAWVKQRLLCGALRLDPDTIRTRGSGRLLAMVSESEALEQAGLSGSWGLGLALLQLASAAVVLPLGAGGLASLAVFLLWSALVAGLCARFLRHRSRWTRARFDLARGFVENVVGHRTRVAQQPAERWHRLEDQALSGYLAVSRSLDSLQAQLDVLPARGWLVLGLASLLPAVLAPASDAELAIALGGILQAYGAFGAFSRHALLVGSALVAWRHVAELFHAATKRPLAGHPAVAFVAPEPTTEARDLAASERGRLALEVRGLSYRYPTGADPALRDCDLSVRRGERVLVEGASGGGKSTLAALLVGLRSPAGGHILLEGLDRPTLGAEGWLRRIASAPQFHHNHVMSATLAFNLLMGRAWPPSPEDRAEAERLCSELGLGPLLRRMPSGLDQVVGETGWQLSQGERSRLFLARALLQHASVVVLDETFGALDPLTLQQCMRAAFARAPALIVIAHP